MTNRHELAVTKDLFQVIDDYLGDAIDARSLRRWVERHPCVVKPYLCTVAELKLLSRLRQLTGRRLNRADLRRYRAELVDFLGGH